MAFIPGPALLEARRHKKLGDLDPVPFALLVNSQLGWTIFSMLKRDYYIFFSSAIGMLFAIVLCLSSIHLLERNNHHPHEEVLRIRVEVILFVSATFWTFLVFLSSIVLGPDQKDLGDQIVGAFCDISSLLYYSAPLARMADIVKRKDSAGTFLHNFYDACLYAI